MNANVITAVVEQITPAIAKEMLKMNTGNFRAKDDHRIERYARDMQNGKWDLTGDALKFNGRKLVDGQHRLHAIVKSGATITTLVVRGVDESCNMDTGKPRNVADWLRHEGYSNCNNLAAAARHALIHDAGMWHWQSVGARGPSSSEIIDYAKSNYESLQDACMLGSRQKLVSRSLMTAIFHIGSGSVLPSDHPVCNYFIDGLSKGAELGEHEPVLLLRNRLDKRDTTNTVTPYMTRMLVTIAWNKTALNQPCKVLRLTLVGPNKTDPPSKIEVAPLE